MLGLIPWLAELLLARKPSLTPAHAQRIASIAVWAVAALLAALAIWVVVDGIGDAREDKITHERTEDALEAERRANTGDAERRAAREAQSRQTEDDLEEIHAEDPDSETRPASRGTRRVIERLRHD